MTIIFGFNGDAELEDSYDCECTDYGGLNAKCKECHGTGRISFSTPLHGVQLSNSNALRLAGILSLDDFDYEGEIEPESLLLKLNGSLLVHVHEDYMQRKLEALRELALAAREAGQAVRWA